MQNILVTGATGFVGQALCQQLLTQPDTAILALTRKNIVSNLKNLFYYRINNITDVIWEPLLTNIDTIVHLAGKVHDMQKLKQQNLNSYYLTNVLATQKLAQAAVKANIRKIIFVSSSKVHGEYSISPFCEHMPANPKGPYAASKYQAEQILKQITANTNTNITILRPPLIYGPMVKANFLQLIKIVNKKFTLPFKTINNQRSMIFINNLTDIITRTINNPKTDNKTYLVSDQQMLSTAELINYIASALEINGKLTQIPCPTMLLKILFKLTGKKNYIDRLLNSFALDITNITQDLAWQAPFSVPQGINATVAWYKSAYK